MCKRDPFVCRLRRETKILFPNNPRTVLGVSGGGDSMALMHLMIQSKLISKEKLTIAHFNHNLRPNAHQEAQFTKETALSLGVTCITATWNNPPSHGNLPALARAARYEFLLSTARQVNASLLATGHHMDDQAETFLERLARGSGPQGLTAMTPARPLTPDVTLVRPLLFLRHQELLNWLTQQGLPWHEDPSNANPRYLRSRIRHQLLPCLQAITHQDLTPQLAATANRMANTNDALEWTLDLLWPNLDAQMNPPENISLSWHAMTGLPTELMRRALLRCHAELTNSPHPPGTRATHLFTHMMRSPATSWTMNMLGLEIQRQKERIILLPGQKTKKNGKKHTP